MAFEADESSRTPAERLAQRVGVRRLSRRQEIWLYLSLEYQVEGCLPLEGCGGHSMQSELLSALLRWARLSDTEIRGSMDSQLLPDERLSWITEDRRQLRWLQRRLPYDVFRLPAGVVHLTDREQLIAGLDVWDVDLTRKEALTCRLRDDWLEHTATDVDFGWFHDKKEGVARCQCAWEWLEKKYLHPRHRRERVESYEGLLMFFDQEALGRTEQQAIVRKIKQRWNRRQLDVRNPGSKQVNVMLTPEAIEQLNLLAKKNGMSKVKVVAALIAKEAELGLYLAED